MAGETGGITQAGSGSRPYRSSLILTPFIFVNWIFAVVLVCALFVAPAAGESIESCQGNLANPTPVTAVHVQPDDGLDPILDEVNFAACSIDLSMYIFTNQEVLDALASAEARGIRVRVILEREPFGSFGDQQEMFDRLKGIGAEVKWGPDRFTYSHAKYMVVDSRVLVATNQNFTNAGFNSNREFGVVTTELRYVREAAATFESDWSGLSSEIEYENLVVSPVNSRSTIIGLIDGSSDSVWMYAEVLRDEEVTTALTAAAERGVDVRVLVNPTATEDDVPYFLDALEHGVQIRVLRDPYVHTKVLIIDGETALVGSQNYSYTSLEMNREVGIIVTGGANLDRIVSVYTRDWTHGEPVDTISSAESRHKNRLDPIASCW